MQYAASLPFRGNTDRAFGLAESALTAIGFRLMERTTGSLDLVGPGMNSSRESALVGASRIHVHSGPGELELKADLGGAARMSRFVTLFPIGLVLFLGVVLSAVFGVRHGPGIWIIVVATVVGGNAALWLLLGPLMARWIRTRTCRGLNALLANMVTVGEAAEPFYGLSLSRGRTESGEEGE
jgi:hypothetical protein